MPLYKLEDEDRRVMVYAKTARGATNHFLAAVRERVKISTVTPLEAVMLAKDGVPVETIGIGPDQVYDDCPPQAKRGHKPTE